MFKVGNNVILGRNMFLYFHCSREVIKIRISSKIINVKQREVICFLIFANFFYMDCLRLRPVTKCDQMTKFFCRIMKENWADYLPFPRVDHYSIMPLYNLCNLLTCIRNIFFHCSSRAHRGLQGI